MKKIAILLAICFCVSTSCLFALGSRENVEIDRFTVARADKIVLEGKVFSLKITGSSSGSIEAVVAAPNKSDYSVKYKVSGDTLRIWCDEYPQFNSGSPVITLKIPSDTQLHAGTLSGDISITGMDGGDMVATSLSGSIDLKECKNDLQCSTASGNITITGFEGRKTVECTSGEIKIKNSIGDIKINGTSGGFVFERVIGNISGGTLSGSIRINSTKGSLHLSTASGDIKGEKVIVTEDSALETASGSIHVDFATSLEDLSFDLTSLSGELSVGDSASERGRLKVGGGRIDIKGSTLSGSQSYR